MAATSKQIEISVPALKFLPESGLGGLILEKEKPIAAAYVYTTNSKLGYIIDNKIDAQVSFYVNKNGTIGYDL